MSSLPLIVKIGGSLYDLPDLGPRLRRWLDANAPRETILVPGGGRFAEVVRDLDRVHQLGDKAAHWMALQSMAVAAAFLATLLEACVIDGPDLAELVWDQGRRPVLDAFAFCESDDADPDRLPNSWDVTSDSVAARLAVVAGAGRLVLLKAAPPPPGDVAAWADAGYVDAWLPRVLAGTDIQVRAVDLRTEKD